MCTLYAYMHKLFIFYLIEQFMHLQIVWLETWKEGYCCFEVCIKQNKTEIT